MSNYATPVDDPLPLLDPARAAERLHTAADVAADSLAHMDTALTAAEAELLIARYHHVHRTARTPAVG